MTMIVQIVQLFVLSFDIIKHAPNLNVNYVI